MFSTDFIFRQQENLVDNQKCQAGFRPLCNKILFPLGGGQKSRNKSPGNKSPSAVLSLQWAPENSIFPPSV